MCVPDWTDVTYHENRNAPWLEKDDDECRCSGGILTDDFGDYPCPLCSFDGLTDHDKWDGMSEKEFLKLNQISTDKICLPSTARSSME
jgi:hypothetical protein